MPSRNWLHTLYPSILRSLLHTNNSHTPSSTCSYLKIIVAINRNKRVLDYRVESRLTMDGARDFKVGAGISRWR